MPVVDSVLWAWLGVVMTVPSAASAGRQSACFPCMTHLVMILEKQFVAASRRYDKSHGFDCSVLLLLTRLDAS